MPGLIDLKAKVVLWRLSPTNKPSSFVFGETVWCPGWAGQSKHHRLGSSESGASGALTRGGLFGGTRVARCGNAHRRHGHSGFARVLRVGPVVNPRGDV